MTSSNPYKTPLAEEEAVRQRFTLLAMRLLFGLTLAPGVSMAIIRNKVKAGKK